MSRNRITDATRRGRKPSNTNISELCKTNEFLIGQNARLLAKKSTGEARLIVACIFLFAETLVLGFIILNGGFA